MRGRGHRRDRGALILLGASALLVVSAGVWGCSDDREVDANPSGVRIGPEGGVVKGDGVEIDIPPGALASPVEITVAATGSAPASYTGLSRLYTFGPDGTAFLKPVGVSFQIDPTAASPVVYWSKTGGGYESVGGSVQADTIKAQVTHFSTGFVGAAPVDDAGTNPSAPGDSGSTDAGDGGEDAGSVKVTLFNRTPLGAPADLTWVVWQDGDGAWTPLSPTSTGVYEITPTSTRYAVATVEAAGVNAQGRLYYRTTATTSLDLVTGSGGVFDRTFGGQMSNMPSGTKRYRFGTVDRTGASSLAGPNYMLYGFREGGSYDIALAAADDSATWEPLKLFFARGQTFAGNLTRDIDWATDGVDLGTPYVATIVNATPETSGSITYCPSCNGLGLGLEKGAPERSTALNQTFYSVPQSAVAPADNYIVSFKDTSRGVSLKRVFHDAANVSTSLPAAATASFAIAEASPYVRPRYTFERVASASSYVVTWSHSGGKQDSRSFSADIEPAWLTSASPSVFEFPDLSTVPGWNAAWAAPPNATGIRTSFTANAKTTLTGGYEETSATKSATLP